MFFERSTGRRFRLRATLAVFGLVSASLAMSLPARAEVLAHPEDDDPTEHYVPKAGYVYDAPRPAGRLAPATGALFGTHSDEFSTKEVPHPTRPGETRRVPATDEDQAIYQLEQRLGRTLDINNHYTGNFEYFLREKERTGQPARLEMQEQFDLDKNRITLVGWACADSSKVVSGALDAAIDAAAEAFKAYPREFFMRYCWEMDGKKRQDTVGKPEAFVDAWRYIYKRVVEHHGVTNVVWVWCANANGYKINEPFTGDKPPAPQYYPGDEYVDWVSADGYNWHGSSSENGKDDYRDFLEIYDEFMKWAREPDAARNKAASSKPIMIGEYGSQEQQDGGEWKATWFRKAHDTVKPRPAGLSANQDKWKGAYSDIQALVYFDVVGLSGDAEGGWAIQTTAKSFEAYKEAALDPWFNQIHTLTWGPYTGVSDDGGDDDNDGGSTTTTTAPPPGVSTDTREAITSTGNGYWMLGEDGKVFAFGQARHHGAPTLPAGVNAADLEATPTGRGYWIVDSTGKVSNHGDAGHFGGIETGILPAGETVTSLSATPSGKGYWIFTNKGRAVRFGDAKFFGDVSKVQLSGPVLDSIPTATGQGYYMVASDGGIFAFGDAVFRGSMGATKLNKPVQSLVPDPDGTGYWLVASDGGIFAFAAPFKGSLGNVKLNKPVTGMVPYGDGYMMVGEDGGIFNFSDKPFDGSLGGSPPARPITSVSVLP